MLDNLQSNIEIIIFIAVVVIRDTNDYSIIIHIYVIKLFLRSILSNTILEG